MLPIALYKNPAHDLFPAFFFSSLSGKRGGAGTLFRIFCFHRFDQAEEGCGFYRVFEVDQFRIGPLLQTIRERFSVFLFVNL